MTSAIFEKYVTDERLGSSVEALAAINLGCSFHITLLLKYFKPGLFIHITINQVIIKLKMNYHHKCGSSFPNGIEDILEFRTFRKLL